MQTVRAPRTLARLLALPLAAPAMAAQSYRIGAPLPLSSEAQAGMVGLSGDGTRVVVNVSPQVTPWGGRFDLVSLSVDASAPPLTLTLATSGVLTSGVASTAPRLTADGAHVAFVTPEGALHGVPCDGAAPPSLLFENVEEFELSPAGLEVVGCSVDPDGARRVRVALADGGAPGRVVSGPFLVATGPNELVLSPDGARVVFLGRQGASGPTGLVSARLDGEGEPVLLTPPETIVAADVGWRISFDGLGVAFLSSVWVPSVFEHVRTLEVVSIDGSFGPHVRSALGITAGGVEDFWFGPLDDRLFYLADLEVDERFELYTVRAVSGAGHAKLNAPTTSRVSDVRVSPDGELASYVVPHHGLFVVRADGSAPAQGLPLGAPPVLADEALHSFQGGRALYYASGELYSQPLDGSAPPVRLSEPRSFTRNTSVHAVLSDGSVLFQQRGDLHAYEELLRVPLEGGVATRLLGPLRRLAAVLPTPAEDRIVYMSAPRADLVLDTYSLPLDGGPPAELGAAPLNGEPIGGVGGFELSADGARVAYVHMGAVLCASTERSGTARELGTDLRGRLDDPHISPDGEWTVWGERVSYSNRTYRIRAAHSDGGEPIELATAGGTGYPNELRQVSISPDGASVVFTRAAPPPLVFGGGRELELCAVPIDGSAPPRALYTFVGLEVLAAPFRFDDATGRLVFGVASRRDLSIATIVLYAADVGAATPASPLTSPFTTRANWAYSCGGGRVLYHSDRDAAGTMELFCVPADGSAPSVKLSSPLGAAQDVKASSLTADGTRALFLADADLDERNELYSAPTDGSGPVVKLNATLVPAGDVLQWTADPLGARVVYLADQELDSRFDLYSVPIDGGPAARLCGETAFFGVQQFKVGAQHVAFTKRVGDEEELFGVALDGSTAPVGLTLGALGYVEGLELTPDGASVVFEASSRLFLASLDGGAPKALTPGVVGSILFRVSPDGRRVVYSVDPDANAERELFAALLERPVRSAAPR